ncbi:winged helix-turn-helix domain-containing protein, partial [Patescibacteria group bacterium]|nr:winged helix-turn-helix domain-containing protein [Patescibacteria group bacterium]
DQVISRNELLDHVWEGKDRYPNTVDAHIESLRQKIDKPFSSQYIKTAYRAGYYFDTHS